MKTTMTTKTIAQDALSKINRTKARRIERLYEIIHNTTNNQSIQQEKEKEREKLAPKKERLQILEGCIDWSLSSDNDNDDNTNHNNRRHCPKRRKINEEEFKKDLAIKGKKTTVHKEFSVSTRPFHNLMENRNNSIATEAPAGNYFSGASLSSLKNNANTNNLGVAVVAQMDDSDYYNDNIENTTIMFVNENTLKQKPPSLKQRSKSTYRFHNKVVQRRNRKSDDRNSSSPYYYVFQVTQTTLRLCPMRCQGMFTRGRNMRGKRSGRAKWKVDPTQKIITVVANNSFEIVRTKIVSKISNILKESWDILD